MGPQDIYGEDHLRIHDVSKVRAGILVDHVPVEFLALRARWCSANRQSAKSLSRTRFEAEIALYARPDRDESASVLTGLVPDESSPDHPYSARAKVRYTADRCRLGLTYRLSSEHGPHGRCDASVPVGDLSPSGHMPLRP